MSATPKRKLKRSRDSSSKELNSSLIKNVTSRVAGLLPASIQKWFSPTKSTSNGTAVMADSSDSSTEDDGEELISAPSKRMRYSHYGQNKFDTHYTDVISLPESKAYDIATPIDGNISYSLQSTSEGCSTYSPIQSPRGRYTFRCETQFASTPITRSQEDSAADVSPRTFNSKFNLSVPGISYGTMRQPITEKETFKKKNKDGSNLKSCIKTNEPKEKWNVRYRRSMLGSPFYPGHTMYGGSSSTYINQPNIKNHVSPVVNAPNDSTTNDMSRAAIQVMELMENYWSPIVEARRKPHHTEPSMEETLLNHSASSTSELSRKKDSKYQELYVPTMATFLRMKQRKRLMGSTAAARQLMASHSSTTEYLPHQSVRKLESDHIDKEPGKFNPKLKSRVTRKRGLESESETLPPLDLHSGGLNIDVDNMPKFSFGQPPDKPSNAPATLSQLPAASKTLSNDILPKKAKLQSKENIFNGAFKFSSPIKLSTDQPDGDSLGKYMFGSPEKSLHKKEENPVEKKVDTAKKWNCPDCWVSNKSDVQKCVCCGGQMPSSQPKKPAKCSTCKFANSQPNKDKCINCEKAPAPVTMNNIGTSKNETGAKKENNNSIKAISVVKPVNAAAAPQGDWRCDVCWVNNKSDVNKCVACGGSKPGASNETSTNTLKSTDSTFSNLLKSQLASKWRCSCCQVTNDNERATCVCCESAKPGSTEETDKKMFTFGTTSNTTFKFGIINKDVAASSEKTVTVENSKPITSETNNNTLPKTPGFSLKSGSDDSEESPKLGFKFGCSKPSAGSKTTEPPTYTFGVQLKTTETSKPVEEKDREQEVPSVNVGDETSKKSDPIKLPLVVTTSKLTNNLLSTSVAVSLPTPNEAKLTQPTATSEKSSVDSAALDFKIKSPLIGSTAAPKLISFTPVESDLKTTVAKAEPPVFPKSDSTPSTAVSAKAVFSFGSGTTAAPKSDSADKLNFSFGSNKTDSSMFKPAFNASGDSSSNKFTLSTSSPAKLSTDASLIVNSTPNNIFSTPPQKESWQLGSTNNTASNGLNANTSANPLQKGAFSFGSSTSFNAGSTLGGISFGARTTNSTTTFGGTVTNSTAAFGSSTTTATPVFGSSTTTTTPVFGSSTTTATPVFGSSTTTATPVFGSSTTTATPVFGSSTTTTTPVFGSPAKAAFGGTKTNATPAFGTNANNSSVFGGSSTTATPAFGSGATNATPTFGSMGANATPAFGSTPAPAFGSSAAAPTPTFGSTASNASTFGSSQSTPAFGGSPAAFGSAPPAFGGSANVFSMPGQQNGPGMFSSPGMFGSSQPAAGGLFGPAPAFDSAALPAAPAPAFNFGSPQNGAVFSFGQQQLPGAGVYNFGSAPGPTSVKFNMGTGAQAPAAPAARRIRKPRRTITPR